MSTYPCRLDSKLTPWQRQFIGAVRERAWLPAAALLTARAAEKPDVTAPDDFADAVVSLIREAPECALAASSLPFPSCSFAQRRNSLLHALLKNHLQRAYIAERNQRFAEVHHQLRRAILFRAPGAAADVLLGTAFAAMTIPIGAAEAGFAAERADLELNPHLPATHPAAMEPDQNGYHPLFVASLIELAIEQATSDATLITMLEAALRSCHWPTWRSLALMSAIPRLELRAVAAKLQPDLAPGARAHLAAFVKGEPWPFAAPQRAADDVDF